MTTLRLYHGSSEKDLKPEYGKGTDHNDFGKGFYCTQDVSLAEEWACKDGSDGYVYEYTIDTDGLDILYLNEEPYNILHSLAMFISNRKIDLHKDRFTRFTEYFKNTFRIDTQPYDIIMGVRADDSSYTIVRDFLGNSITLEQLKISLELGKLGVQIMIRSEKSFDRLKPIQRTKVFSKDHYPKYLARNKDALKGFHEILEKPKESKGVYAEEIVYEKWEEFDARLY